MSRLICCFFLLAASAGANAEVIGRTVNYQAGDTRLVGFFAYDDQIKGQRPGVLVVHEWWGLNDYVRERARQLAGLGYAALAVDMYGNGKQVEHPKEAGELSAQVSRDWEAERARFLAAMELLKRQPESDPQRIAAVGYCFGGGVVLDMARAGTDLDGVVTFHGTLGTERPAQPGAVKAKILVLTGADDPFVPREQVERFRAEMEHAGADYRVVTYPGAKHAFTNPDADGYGERFNLPLAYNAEADRASWQEMQDFFNRIFGR